MSTEPPAPATLQPEPIDDIGEYYRDRDAANKQHRAAERGRAPATLAEAGIRFEDKNNGAHLIVYAADVVVDFWPGTQLWIVRGTGERGKGVRKLISACLRAEGRPMPVIARRGGGSSTPSEDLGRIARSARD